MADFLCFVRESPFFVNNLLWNRERIDFQVLKIPYWCLG